MCLFRSTSIILKHLPDPEGWQNGKIDSENYITISKTRYNWVFSLLEYMDSFNITRAYFTFCD
jgi:hypothetical protein